LVSRQFDKNDPNWLSSKIQSDLLADEAELINFGFEKETLVNTFGVYEFRPSLMADYPFNYKFTSVEIGARPTRKVYQRVTYDILNAFGDVGGVCEFLRLIIVFFVTGCSLTIE
jgi:hypothetical protein